METVSSSRLIIAARVVLLAIGLCALVLGFVAGRAQDGARHTNGRFVCPMHPEVSQETLGECPICHMSLVERTALRLATDLFAPHELHPGAHPLHDLLGTVSSREFSGQITAPAWIDGDGKLVAHLYHDELDELTPDQRGSYVTSGTRLPPMSVRLLGDSPRPWDEATVELRFTFDEDGAHRLPASQVGWLEVPVKGRALPVAPVEAVLQSSNGPYVLAATAGGAGVEKRPIEIGRVLYGVAVICSGLKLGEQYVLRNAFLLDAERRLDEKTGPRL